MTFSHLCGLVNDPVTNLKIVGQYTGQYSLSAIDSPPGFRLVVDSDNGAYFPNSIWIAIGATQEAVPVTVVRTTRAIVPS